jgi:hypothetical protein
LSEMWPVVETCGTLHRHERTCTGSVIYKYPGGVYHTAKTVFDRLEDEGIEVPAEFYGILIAACIMKSVSCIVYKIKKVCNDNVNNEIRNVVFSNVAGFFLWKTTYFWKSTGKWYAENK